MNEIDENKLLDELEETFTDEFLHEKKFCLARYSFMDLLKEMINELTKVDCGNCSRRKFYQKGYQDGLNANKWIPCSSGKLPQRQDSENFNLEMYLVRLKDNRIRLGYRDEKGTWRNEHWNKLNVIEWKSIDTEPYKEEVN